MQNVSVAITRNAKSSMNPKCGAAIAAVSHSTSGPPALFSVLHVKLCRTASMRHHCHVVEQHPSLPSIMLRLSCSRGPKPSWFCPSYTRSLPANHPDASIRWRSSVSSHLRTIEERIDPRPQLRNSTATSASSALGGPPRYAARSDSRHSRSSARSANPPDIHVKPIIDTMRTRLRAPRSTPHARPVHS